MQKFSFISVPLGRNPPDIEGLEPQKWTKSTKTVLTWNPSVFNSSQVDIKISQFDATEFRLHDASLASFKNIPNTGKYLLDFSSEKIFPKTL